MTAIPLRPNSRRDRGLARPAIYALLGAAVLAAAAVVLDTLIEDYRDGIVLRGLDGKPSPVALVVAGEPMTIPANMIRFRSERRGGALDRVNLLLHWPDLGGFSDAFAEDFKSPAPTAPLIFVTISGRDTPLDAGARLKSVYARFFEGAPVAGPAGLVGHRLSEESGYGGEVVYAARGNGLFVARCLADETADIAATCIRDVNVGQRLSMLYRFNRSMLANWQAMDAGLRMLAAGFLGKTGT
jgi:hypothetical protein